MRYMVTYSDGTRATLAASSIEHARRMGYAFHTAPVLSCERI